MSDAGDDPARGAQTLQVILDPASVRAWTDRAMQESLAIMACALPALRGADMVAPAIPGATITMTFPVTPQEAEARRARCKLWLLTKGLHEIARAVRTALEEAYIYLGLVARFLAGGDGLIDTALFNAEVARLKKAANGMNFPNLLQAVNAGLTEPLEFVEEYQSLNRVRNCLEHRGGYVGEADARDDGVLRLVLPRMDIVIIHDDESETPLVLHKPIAGGRVVYRRGRSERTYAVGEVVAFDEADFAEIAQSCVFFGADLAAKLPTRGAGDGAIATPEAQGPTVRDGEVLDSPGPTS